LAETIAIPASYSPFILDRVMTRIQSDHAAAFLAHQMTADQTARRTAEQVNAEISRRLDEEPALKPLYEQGVANQERIDALRARGERVPLELITNPFHRRYYVAMGWSR
jgi:hypothetical protein